MKAVTTFHSIVEAAEQTRPGYARSIGYTRNEKYAPTDLPGNLFSIFRFAIGTPSDISDQTLMDFVPGHHLVLASEIPDVRSQLQKFYGVDELFHVQSRTPFLANYSSDFYLTGDDDSGVFWLDHTGGTSRVSPNLSTFLLTTLQCYEQGVYRLGPDGMLDFDDERELEIARGLNPDCDFWLD